MSAAHRSAVEGPVRWGIVGTGGMADVTTRELHGLGKETALSLIHI